MRFGVNVSVIGVACAVLLFGGASASMAAPARVEIAQADGLPTLRPAGDFSPALLGMYRKVLRIDPDILRYTSKYGVDPMLARAVCLYESGGNPNLTSGAGAHGYFQVMPSTFRLMHVRSNIEAGIKYLGQLVHQLGREDYALAAYNGGPGRVAARRPMPLESLQYVLGVSAYRSALKAYEPSIRHDALQLSLTTVRSGEDWWDLGSRLHMPVLQLRLHNPFLAARPLRAGALIAYPETPRTDVLDDDEGQAFYRTRIGDNYLNIAFMLGVDIDRFREINGLWRLEPLLPGTDLQIPMDDDAGYVTYTTHAGDTLLQLAKTLQTDPWTLERDNQLWDEVVPEGSVLRIRRTRPAPPSPPKPLPAFITHVVKRGETLTSLARRYGTTVGRIQADNGLGRRTMVRIGQRLRVPRP